jgi:hypothetical protein
MNRARRALSAGLHPDELEGFERLVVESVAQLEAICRANRLAPQALPAPTYRAYLYLKGIDLKNLPVRQASPAPGDSRPGRAQASAGKALPSHGLLALCKEVQQELGRLAAGPKPSGGGTDPGAPAIERLVERIGSNLAEIERASARSGIPLHDLPAPTRRAYAWLKYISTPDQLQLHLQALRTALKAAEKAACRKKLFIARRSLPVRVEFFNTASLYRGRPQKDGLHLTASEGFVAAGPEVIEALVCAALGSKRGEVVQTVRRFAESEDFAEVLLALELTIDQPAGSGRGRNFDLEEVFERVNREYFSGELARPRLTWNRTLTHRKLGHYQPATDTVLISITLDQPGIPAVVVDFVMYHELLHKKLGIPLINGRRWAHNPEFRRAEKQFRQYAEAQDFLKKIGSAKATPYL